MRHKASFTLIELLIVIGILAVLVVTVLITLNPAEAQKKTRDNQRIKDMLTLKAIIDQYVDDGNPVFCNLPDGVSPCDTRSGKTKCNDNWLGRNLCQYARTIPIDPINTRIIRICHPTNPNYTAMIFYRFKMNSGYEFEFDTPLESKSNCDKAMNDGGTQSTHLEVGTRLDVL